MSMSSVRGIYIFNLCPISYSENTFFDGFKKRCSVYDLMVLRKLIYSRANIQEREMQLVKGNLFFLSVYSVPGT